MTKFALVALVATLLAGPTLAGDVPPAPFDNGEQLCGERPASCIRTAQDFTVSEFVRIMQIALPGPHLNHSSVERLIEENGWIGVTANDTIPAGTRVRL